MRQSLHEQSIYVLVVRSGQEIDDREGAEEGGSPSLEPEVGRGLFDLGFRFRVSHPVVEAGSTHQGYMEQHSIFDADWTGRVTLERGVGGGQGPTGSIDLAFSLGEIGVKQEGSAVLASSRLLHCLIGLRVATKGLVLEVVPVLVLAGAAGGQDQLVLLGRVLPELL